jgi:hypothetical protein
LVAAHHWGLNNCPAKNNQNRGVFRTVFVFALWVILASGGDIYGKKKQFRHISLSSKYLRAKRKPHEVPKDLARLHASI